jgi:hypothetical protein
MEGGLLMLTHPVEILISSILIKPEYYPRFQTDPERIKEFVENMECGETFPPIKVAKDEATGFYVLLDGKHRIEAYKLREVDKILVYIFPVKKEHWLMTAARFNSKSSKPLLPEELKQIIIQSWRNGIKDTDEIAREMGRTVRYIEMILKAVREAEFNKREEKIMKLHRKGMSQREIASKIGLSPGYISKRLNSNEDYVVGGFNKENELISGSHKTIQVLPKRNDFVLEAPIKCQNINILESSLKNIGDEKFPFIVINQETDEDKKNIKTSITDIPGVLEEKSESDEVLPKRNDFVLEAPDKNNNFEILDGTEKKQHQNFVPKKSILSNHNNPDFTGKIEDPHKTKLTSETISAIIKKTSPYPSYLDQIDLYREFPIQWKQAIRAMELVKIYKLDIVDITDEINEPILWVKKVLVAAIALSLMNSDDLNDASSVEVLLGLDIEIVKCIQNFLYCKEMVCPIAPDMENWFKENLSANDLDMIAELSGVSRDNLPYLLKGQAPPPKAQCFKEFPDSYKKQISAFIRLLSEIHEHAKNKMFNHNSAKDLLFHLNRNQTAINEIIDVLRQYVLL